MRTRASRAAARLREALWVRLRAYKGRGDGREPGDGLTWVVGFGLEAAEDVVDAVDGLVQAFEAG